MLCHATNSSEPAPADSALHRPATTARTVHCADAIPSIIPAPRSRVAMAIIVAPVRTSAAQVAVRNPRVVLTGQSSIVGSGGKSRIEAREHQGHGMGRTWG